FPQKRVVANRRSRSPDRVVIDNHPRLFAHNRLLRYRIFGAMLAENLHGPAERPKRQKAGNRKSNRAGARDPGPQWPIETRAGHKRGMRLPDDNLPGNHRWKHKYITEKRAAKGSAGSARDQNGHGADRYQI